MHKYNGLKNNMERKNAPTREGKSNSGLLLFCFVIMLLGVVAVLIPLFPNDFWPYLRIGQEIVRTRSIPSFEFMTFTQYGHPVVYLYWLPSLVFLGIFRLGGVNLISLFSLICILTFYSLLWICLRQIKINPLIAGITILITAIVGINFWSFRPQILVYPIFGMVLLAIIRWLQKDCCLIWTIPFLTLFWVNLHGSFIVVFLILISAILFGTGDRKKLVIVTVLSLLSTFINPYGVKLWGDMFSMVNNASIQQFSTEWKAPQNIGWQANIFFGTILAIPVLSVIAKQKINILFWVWFVGFGWMAFTSERYGAWFLGIETLLLAQLLQPIANRYLRQTPRLLNKYMNLAIGILLLTFPIALLPGVRSLWWQKAPSIYDERTPTKAVDWLQKNPQLQGELWSDFSYSTYMTYALPERKLFMTNRFEDFPPQQFVDNLHISKADYDWQQVVDKYGINLIMASEKMEPELIHAVSSSKNWKEVYRDGQTVIFEQNKP
jgi:hypothetical protein